MEDGLPLSYAPYGDNASYYHPPVDRFERIEVLKGAEQILFGPQTSSGIINYITPTPPLKPQGFLGFTGGSRDYYNVHANYGGTWNRVGGLLDYIHRQSDGSRDNTHFDVNDVNLKGLFDINQRNALILRGNYYGEDSQVGYTGITEAELRNFGIRYNPFKNDEFDADRWGTSATHEIYFNDDLTLTTSFYWSHFHRDWWRQSSRTTDTQCDATLINGRTFSEARQAGLAVTSMPAIRFRGGCVITIPGGSSRACMLPIASSVYRARWISAFAPITKNSSVYKRMALHPRHAVEPGPRTTNVSPTPMRASSRIALSWVAGQ